LFSTFFVEYRPGLRGSIAPRIHAVFPAEQLLENPKASDTSLHKYLATSFNQTAPPDSRAAVNCVAVAVKSIWGSSFELSKRKQAVGDSHGLRKKSPD
jgi:hypothetical protein